MRSSNSMFILMKLKTRKNMMKIKIQEIKDRGNDEERIVLRVLEDCNLGRYLVLDTTFDKNGNISNKNRQGFVADSNLGNGSGFRNNTSLHEWKADLREHTGVYFLCSHLGV